MQKTKELIKERPILQSVLYMVNECINCLEALKELDKFAKRVKQMTLKDRDNLVVKDTIVPTVYGITRDYLCISLRRLFDTDSRSHSLKKYYKGSLLDELEKNPLVVEAIYAANKNIAHLDKGYTSWPSVEAILSSDIGPLLKAIQLGILLDQTGY